MTSTATKSDVRHLLTEDIDAQIAELRAKKTKLAAAGRALVAAADEVDARKAAVKDAEKAFGDRRQDLIDLGMKPRDVSRLLKELRATDSVPSQSSSAVEQIDRDGVNEPPVDAVTDAVDAGQGGQW